MADACLMCHGPLERPETGRPPSYCSTSCRRAAEYELRRLQRRLERLETEASYHRVRGNQIMVKRLETEVMRATTRLRQLLAGHPNPEKAPAV
jgi:hypothetical protein